MNYTIFTQLIALSITGAIVLALNWLFRSLNQQETSQPGLLKALKVIAFLLLLVPVMFSPFVFILFPGMRTFYFTEFIFGFVFVLSFLIFESILGRISPLMVFIDRLASMAVDIFLSIGTRVVGHLPSRHSPILHSQVVNAFMEYDLGNRYKEFVIQELNSADMDIDTRNKAYNYGYVNYITLADDEDELEVFQMFNAASEIQQEHMQKMPREQFLADIISMANTRQA